MCQENPVAVRGQAFAVEWARDARGQCPARDFFNALDDADKAKMLALFGRLATTGRIASRENFRQLGRQAKGEARGLWEFKKFQLRFLGDYRSGRRFVIALGLRKKQDDHSPADIEKAVRILRENDAATEAHRR